MKVLSLIQEQGFTRNEFILMDETLSIKQFTLSEHKEQVIKLENLGHKTMMEKDSGYIKIGFSLFFGFSSLLFIVANAADHSKHIDTWLWIAISMAYAWFSVIVYLLPINNKLSLVNGIEDLVLLTNKPSDKEVREFVKEIISRSKKVLLKKYSPDSDLPENTMLSQLNRLLGNGVIDQEEFDKLKTNYYFNQSLRNK